MTENNSCAKSSSCTCGCCEGIEVLTPLSTANRPGLDALIYRIGTHTSFLETMKAKLSSYTELLALTTRDTSDPSIALLDAWATVADVLTFYQERIANEGYLLTATERRSILELARLIGYKLRPGVASTAFLAYTLDEDRSKDPPIPTHTLIPKGSRSQSIPGPDELPQSFETSYDLEARSEWNELKVRLTRPQNRLTIRNILGIEDSMRVYLSGVSTNLKKNDPLLIQFGKRTPELFRVIDVETQPDQNRTLVKIDDWLQNKNEYLSRVSELIQYFSAYGEFGFTEKDIEIAAEFMGKISISRENTIKVFDALSNETMSSFVLMNWHAQVIFELELALTVTSDSPSKSVSKSRFSFEDAFNRLTLTPSVPSRNSASLSRTAESLFDTKSLVSGEPGLRAIAALRPELQNQLQAGIKNAVITPKENIKVYTLRTKASLFGHNSPGKLKYDGVTGTTLVKPAFDPWTPADIRAFELGSLSGANTWSSTTLFLDIEYEKIIAGDWVLLDSSAINAQEVSTKSLIEFSTKPFVKTVENGVLITKTNSISFCSRNAYGISAKSTRIDLDFTNKFNGDINSWLLIPKDLDRSFDYFEAIRKTIVYSQSEELILAEETITDPVCDGSGISVELNGYYPDLKSGRWAIVSGERDDIPGTSGVMSAELIMISGVNHDVEYLEFGSVRIPLPGDTNHTFLTFDKPLSYCYKRGTVKIYGNVVKATHGETKKEVLGSGNGTAVLQQFSLKQSPLTFVAANDPSGVESTLVVRVNDIEWHEEKINLIELSRLDRKFITDTTDEGTTIITFGDGEHGARIPTGQANVSATYRNGIGKPGNVKSEQISLLVSRPLGVKSVINPLRASGGADKESRDQARKNAPLAVTALDRLVSVQDYADFARIFAGIGKSYAAILTDGQRRFVHVTVAGADDIPIDESSDVYNNLYKALHDFGDPYLPIQLQVRELALLVIVANVKILPDYLWESVASNLRTQLLSTFSFERRELGQDVLLSEVISAVQSVEGVEYVDVDKLRAIPEKIISGSDRVLITPEEISTYVLDDPRNLNGILLMDRAGNPLKDPLKRITVNVSAVTNGISCPAQLAYLTPDVPETLILNQIQ